MEKLIVTVAPTGSVPTREMTPHVPISPREIIETGIRCEAAGASVLHIHARDQVDQSASTDYALFEETYTGLKERTNLVLQISTGGRAGMAYEQRCERLNLNPEMASLTTGSVNFPNAIYENSPALIEALARDMLARGIKPEIEVFDVSMIHNAQALTTAGLAVPPLHFDFVLGLKGAIPFTLENLVHLRNCLPPDATWTAAGIGRHQLSVNVHTILMGGHVRVGLEDNIYYRRGEKATNEQLVERVVRLSRELGREIATPDEAREILALKKRSTE